MSFRMTSFENILTHVFTSECDNLRLAQTLEFNPQFLSLKWFKIYSKNVI